jgi:hypothetical protein
VRILITALLLGACALAPVAAAQTAGPSVSTGRATTTAGKTPAAKGKHARPAVKKRPVHHTARSSHGARTASRGKAAPHRAPAKQTAIGLPTPVLSV